MFIEDFASGSTKRTKSDSRRQVKEAKKVENSSNCENKAPQHRYGIFFWQILSSLF